MVEHRLTIAISPDGWVIDGELDHLSADSLRDWCNQIEATPESRRLEMAGLDILDSDGIAAVIDVIRLLMQHIPALTLAHPPHLLAHTLYRIGMLDTDRRLSLFEPRQEEPYG